MRILVVEDESKVASALSKGLVAADYQVDVAETGEEGFFLLNQKTYDLVILDLMLPHCSGSEFLSVIRRRVQHMPVLVLTAKDSIDDRVQSLDLGADDYLIKPFAFPELLARVRALLRRGHSVELPKLQEEDLEIDTFARRAARGMRPLSLTAREFDVAVYLLRRHGTVVSREMLAHEVWKVSDRATPLDNAIDVTMARLRRKIDDPHERKLLHTVRGLGYMLGSPRP